MNKERVVLVHGYLTDREGKDRPDRLTRIGILAAAELYRHGEIDKICFTAEKELSNSQVKRIRTLLNNPPEEDIVVEARAVTTEEEVKTFNRMSEENNWGNLLTIGNQEHLPRIEREIRKTFKDKPVEVISSKEVLSAYPRYSSILSDMEDWPEQISLSLQEKVLSFPIIERLALKIISYLLRYKIAMQKWAFRQVELNKF